MKITKNSHSTRKRKTFNGWAHQWTMDSGSGDNDKFVVCAPRLISDQSRYMHYLMHGICYLTSNTSSNAPESVQKIAPLRLRPKQQYKVSDNELYFYYIYGEQGFNVHITPNSEEILIGAPGIFGWKGSVISYKPKPLIDLDGLSRRNDNATSFRRRKMKTESIEYSSEIPNPIFWNDEFDTYLGYAVSSGYFDGTKQLHYVASAPHANQQQGAVYIFDIVDHFSASDKTIKIYHTFSGQQLGEYYGCSLLTEDFDNDGLTDIAIGAPYNSKVGTYENGAIYIYKNEGTSSDFVLHSVLRSDYEFSGRFGTTLSKVGDINQDGFNDLIVAAPFEENGAIYIYHGSLNGLPTKASQRIAAPQSSTFLSNQMFGHGLSKGADIDGNQYLDIAVGSPNAEAVYIYKSYPVIRINATIIPLSQEIQTNDKSFKFNVCWRYESKHSIGFDINFNATVKLDGQLGRAVFQDKVNEYEITGKITSKEQCVLLEAFVTFSIADIFRPIEIEMTHNVLNVMPTTDNNAVEIEDFCETCVAVNPNDSKNVGNKIVFSTGCKNTRCVADLKVTAILEDMPSLPYILGSTSSLVIAFDIGNIGETAYLAQIRITLPEGVHFTKLPSNCKLDFTVPNLNMMECILNGGIPMYKDTNTTINTSIDTTRLDGKELSIKTEVFSAGDERNDFDNTIESIIPLAEFSNIEVIGNSPRNHLKFVSGADQVNITHTFEIHNNGPSNIKSLDILISLPLSHVNPTTLKRVKLVDISSVSMESTYNGKDSEVEWRQNNTILILDAIGSEHQVNDGQVPTGDYSISRSIENRNRRSLENVHFKSFMRKAIESDEMTSLEQNSVSWSDMSLISNQSESDIFNFNDRIISALPSNRTIYSDCKSDELEFCLQGKLRVTNQPFTIITKLVINSTPLWVYLLSFRGGILLLLLISGAMHKFGFFKREARDDLVKVKRESQMMSYWVVPGEEPIDDD